MIYLECREAKRDNFDEGRSCTFRRGVVEARHPWGAQDEYCLTLTDVPLMKDRHWVYICGDKLSSYYNGEPASLTLENTQTAPSPVAPTNESTFSISVCGSFTDSLNCYQIDGEHYEPIPYQKLANFFNSCLDELGSSSPLKIHLLMPYAARIIMTSLPPDLCQNNYYSKILDKPHVLDKGIFSTFAYRFCTELRALKPYLNFCVYAPIGDFRPDFGMLKWETETGFLFRFRNLGNGSSFTDFESCNFSDFPSHFGMNEEALIRYDFPGDSISIWGGGSAPLYNGDEVPPYTEGSDIEPSKHDGFVPYYYEKDRSGKKEAPDRRHDKYLRSESE